MTTQPGLSLPLTGTMVARCCRCIMGGLILPWIAANAVRAQSPETHPLALSIGAGLGAATSDQGAASASLSLGYRQFVLRARYTVAFDRAVLSSGDYHDFGILLGLRSARRVHFSVTTGLGRMKGTAGCKSCTPPSSPKTVLGFLIDGQVRIPFVKALGLIVTALSDLNAHHSFGGLTAGLYIGAF
jgi:hypothetical protein